MERAVPDMKSETNVSKDPTEEKAREVAEISPAEENLELARTVSGPPYSIFTSKQKLFIVLMVATSALISPFAATLFYPALTVLANELHVSDSLITLSVTTYMIAQAIAPACIAGISDQSGRRLSFIICFTIYIVANIGLALQTNYAALLVLRCVQAFGSSATIALSMAVTADVATSAERGKFGGYATGGILVGPAIGPVLGGILAEYLGWRSIFYFLAIFGACLFIVFTAFVPETCRNVVGNGSIPATGINRSVLGYIQQRKHAGDVESQVLHPKKKTKFIMPNPLLTLKILKEKESALVLLYNGLFLNGQMVVSTALPTMLKNYYGYNELTQGLCFIPLGIGSMISALGMGRVVDWNFKRHARKTGFVFSKTRQQDLTDFPIESARIEVVAPAHVFGTASLIIFGWTMKYKTHISGPLIMLFCIGLGISTAFNTSNTLLIDLHRAKPATATAAVNFVRCLISAGGVAAIVPMVHAMNPGWCFTFLGLLYVVLLPALWLIVKMGPKWRRELREKREEQAKSEEVTASVKESEISIQAASNKVVVEEEEQAETLRQVEKSKGKV